MTGSTSASPFHTWEAALNQALFLAEATNVVHRVEHVDPTPEWPWHRWRVSRTEFYVVARQALRAAETLRQRIDKAVGSHVPGILL